MRKFKPFYSFLRYSYASPDVLGSFLLEESQANKGSSRFQLRSGKELSDTFGCFDGFEVPVATQTKNPVSTKSFFSQLKEEPIFWQLTELLWTCTCMLQAAAEGSSPARSRTSFKAGSGHPAPRPAADGGRLPAAGDPPADGLPGEDSALVPVGILLCCRLCPPAPLGRAWLCLDSLPAGTGMSTKMHHLVMDDSQGGGAEKNLSVSWLGSNDLWRGYGQFYGIPLFLLI